MTANLTNLDSEIENVKIHNDGPLRFSLSKQSLQIDQFHLLGEGTDVSATGQVLLSGDPELDLRAQGQVNLKLIESFDPEFSSSGLVTADVSVSGTYSKPITQGRLRVDHGIDFLH